MQHNHGKSQKMQSFQGFRQAFVVPHQTTEAAHPAETALDNPTTGQQDKAALGIGQFDDFQAQPCSAAAWAASSPV